MSNNPSHRKAYGAGALVALAVLFIGLIILITFALRGARADLTESKLYTLAPGTQHIVSSLKEPVNLYFFFSQDESKESPQLRTYAQRVRELLEELSQRSKGKLRLNIIDPKPFSEDEDRAGEFGLTPIPSNGQQIYFGLAGTNSTDGREVISVFQPEKEEFLEYDVASLIQRLANPKKAKVGLMSSLPVDASFNQMSGRMQEGWASIAQLRELFDVQTVATDAGTIDPSIDVLMVIHPKNLSQQSLYAIDQFVLRGGKLIAFMDPQSENDNAGSQMGMPTGPRSSTLGPLLDAWGVSFDTANIVADRTLGLTVSLRQGQPPSQHIAIIGFNHSSMNTKDVITSALDSINTMTVGALKKKEGATIEFEPLIQSSTDAALLPTARAAFLPDSEALLEGFKPTGERYVVAARIHGKLKSAFPNGKPAAASDKTSAPEGEHLTESKTDANIILVGDTDILADPLWVRTQNVFGQRFAVAWANNGDFVSNALDNLAGSSDLISIRGRQSFFRPFTKVEALRRQADDQLRAKKNELDQELKETERKLSELEANRGNENSLVLTPEQEAELQRFQDERLRVRKELREVQRSLDQDIENLGFVLKLINIGAVPLLIAIGAIVLAVSRRRRLRAGRAAAHTG
jgi:ABC-type uncharacterized transport system involved in gliding motility auxiliary subunit